MCNDVYRWRERCAARGGSIKEWVCMGALVGDGQALPHIQAVKVHENRERERAPALTLSEPTHSPDSWAAHMKGSRVAGQHADSAAGYCPSKPLSYSENILIHLHIFSPQLNTHSHMHQTRTGPESTRMHTSKTHLVAIQS